MALTTPVGDLRLGERQLVEIARALLVDSRVLILDEPNSALNAPESERLFRVVRQLRARGVAVVYVSHRLEEVVALADAITVVRNGRVVATRPSAAWRLTDLVTAMIGRAPDPPARAARQRRSDQGALRLEGVSVDGQLADVSLTAAPGELVGLAGLEGAGTQAIFDAVFGLRPPDRGRVILPDAGTGPRTVMEAVRRGVAYVPPDRRTLGLMLDADILANLVQVGAGTLGRHGFRLRRRELAGRASEVSRALRVKAPSLAAPASQLSGGNQQKIVLGKWLEAEPRVVLLNDPTRGVDVGAKAEILAIVERLVQEGRVVLLASSELPELVRCDRVLVLYRGRLVGQLTGEALTEHRLLEAINTGERGALT